MFDRSFRHEYPLRFCNGLFSEDMRDPYQQAVFAAIKSEESSVAKSFWNESSLWKKIGSDPVSP